MDWYPRRPQSYRNDTWGLTLAEHGAYCLLLDYYYQSEHPLPNDDHALAGIIGITIDKWLEVKEKVTRYFRVSNAHLTHHTCDEVIDRSLGRRNDGLQRQVKYKKRLESVTRYKRVSNAPRGEDRILEEKEESISSPNGEAVEFNSFWNTYPKKVAKGGALKAYKSAIKRGATHEQLRSGAERYVIACRQARTEKQFTKNPATWLNQDCWLDEDGPPSGNRGNGQRASVVAAALAAVGRGNDER